VCVCYSSHTTSKLFASSENTADCYNPVYEPI